MTTAQAAAAVGVAPWMVRSMIWRKVLGPPVKCGPTFTWSEQDLERLRQAARQEGYVQ
jgi:hypothetical protein